MVNTCEGTRLELNEVYDKYLDYNMATYICLEVLPD